MKAVFQRIALCVLGLASVSCGTVRDGTGTSYLIVESLAFAKGDTPDEFTSVLLSDVEVMIDDSPTYFNDLGQATFSVGLKDPGTAGSPNTPTANQFITVDRYHVKFIRADGRNTQGVDVPYEFDGAFTATVGGGTTEAGFTVVRHDAKREAPLAALRRNPVVLSTIVEITFYGRDRTGREVVATARASIDFGNFADSE